MRSFVIDSKANGRQTVFVDDEDLDRVISFRYSWHIVKITTSSKRSRLVVDHIDGNALNNTKANLRVCTQSENLRNSPIRSSNKTGYKGVQRLPYSYRAWIRRDGKSVCLGCFKTAELAGEAYKTAAREEYGEFYRER